MDDTHNVRAPIEGDDDDVSEEEKEEELPRG
jgi:hypothetical protein